MESNPIKFVVAGLVTSIDFQRCRYMVSKLHTCMPDEYEPPEIRPMFDVEWNIYLLKMRRKHSHGFWAIKNCAVIMNDQLLGNCAALVSYISKRYRFVLYEDWYEISRQHVFECLMERAENFRQLVYLTVAIANKSIGTMLFVLYNDLVPRTCENFLNEYVENQHISIPIQRIVEKSWVQCGDPRETFSNMPCENYAVPHDQRGVLSMCNNGRHTDNTTSFFITLDSAPWMDYKYVAFGQLLQGDDVLKRIEQISTYYQSPTIAIDIVKIGEFPLPNRATEEICTKDELDRYFETLFTGDDIIKYLQSFTQDQKDADENTDFKLQVDADTDDLKSGDSSFSFNKFQLGYYSLPTDRRTDFRSFIHLPYYLMQGGGESEDPCGSNLRDIDEKRKPFYMFPSNSDVTI